MIMKPLLFHSSNRSSSVNHRCVIHLEFSNGLLPDGLRWSEYLNLENNQENAELAFISACNQ